MTGPVFTATAIQVWQRAVKLVARPFLRRAARKALQGRLLDPHDPMRGRWLRADVQAFVEATWLRVDDLLRAARLEKLPTYGNRLNVFMAVVTTAAYQEMLDRGVSREYAATLVADIGWKIYGWMLTVAATPARILTRSPRRQLEWTLKLLMRFPFSAPGKPGYEVRAWSDGEAFLTHWTHCPPQAFVRSLVEAGEDRGELEAFYRSWCLYDWAGADLLVADGGHGHYERPHTMSRGDAVCDMCWWAGSAGNRARVPAGGPAEGQQHTSCRAPSAGVTPRSDGSRSTGDQPLETPRDQRDDNWIHIHPLVVRITHWVNAIAILIMVTSGMRIFNASPLFDFRFPNELTLGGWLGGALQWHFAAMWLLAANGLVYLIYGVVSGHFRRKLLPVTPRAVLQDTLAVLRGRFAHDDLSVYTTAQRAAYLSLILVATILIFSGLAVWKPVQLQELAFVFGGYEGARWVHFVAMAIMIFIVLVHVLMVILVPRTLPTMITGRLRRSA